MITKDQQTSPVTYSRDQMFLYYDRPVRLLTPIAGRHGRVIGWDYRGEDGRILYAPLRRLRRYGRSIHD